MDFKDKRIWSDESTKFLVERFKYYTKDFLSGNIRLKKVIFEKISEDLKKIGEDFTPNQVTNRWKALIRMWRRCLIKGVTTIRNNKIRALVEEITEIVKDPKLGYTKMNLNMESTFNDDDDDDDDEDDDDDDVVYRGRIDNIKERPINISVENVVSDDSTPDPFVGIATTENFIDMKSSSAAIKSITRPKPSVHNINNRKVKSELNDSKQSSTGKTSSVDTNELTTILKKFTAEKLKHSRENLIIQQKKIRLMNERNQILKNFKITSQSVSNNKSIKFNENSNETNEFFVMAENFSGPIAEDTSKEQIKGWLINNNLNIYGTSFQNFNGLDILRLNKDDLIQICGTADGIRMYNLLHLRTVEPLLTIYVTFDSNQYNAIYLITITFKEFMQKLFRISEFKELLLNSYNLNEVNDNTFLELGFTLYTEGPNAINVIVTDDVLKNTTNNSFFMITLHEDYKVLMKQVPSNM